MTNVHSSGRAPCRLPRLAWQGSRASAKRSRPAPKTRVVSQGLSECPRISRAFDRTFILRADPLSSQWIRQSTRVRPTIAECGGVSQMCRIVVLSAHACPWLSLRESLSDSIGRSTVLFSTITQARLRAHCFAFVAVQRTSASPFKKQPFRLAPLGLNPFGAFCVLPLFDLRNCLFPFLATLEPAGGKVALVKFSSFRLRVGLPQFVLLPIQARCHGSVAPHLSGHVLGAALGCDRDVPDPAFRSARASGEESPINRLAHSGLV